MARLKKKHKRPGVGWTDDKVRVLSTDVILERLGSAGVLTSTDDFVQQARAEHAARAIVEAWRERFPVAARGVGDEFIDGAARVLWERLLPERPSFEMLDERMQGGYVRLWTNHDVVRTCDRWLEVWEGIKLHFAPKMTRVRDVDAVLAGTETSSTGARSSRTSWATQCARPALLARSRAVRERISGPVHCRR